MEETKDPVPEAVYEETGDAKVARDFQEALHHKIALLGDENLRNVLYDIMYGPFNKLHPAHPENANNTAAALGVTSTSGFCTQCGTAKTATAKFCRTCGAAQ